MSTDAPTLNPEDDFTVIPNLAANALPITPLMVAMVEYVQRTKLTSMRLRDSWLGAGVAGPNVSFALAIGGSERGGANGALWGRLRMHSLYLSDADLPVLESEPMMKNWAVVTFLVPGTCRRTVDRLIAIAPHVKEDPLTKYRAAGAGLVAKAEVDPTRLSNTLQALAVLVETLHTPRASEGGAA